MELIEREALREKAIECGKLAKQDPRLLVVGLGYVLDAPAIDAAPVVHGRLIHAPCSHDRFEDCYKCSVCGAEYGADYFGPDVNYCASCGARMNGGEIHEAD